MCPHVSSAPKKISLVIYKIFFCPGVKIKKGVAGKGGWEGLRRKENWTRGTQPHSHPSFPLLYYSSASSHPSFSMLMEDKIGHQGIGWCSHSDLCLPWHIVHVSPPPLHPSLFFLSLFLPCCCRHWLIIPSLSPALSQSSPFFDTVSPALHSLTSLPSFDDSWTLLLLSIAHLPLSNSPVSFLLVVEE